MKQSKFSLDENIIEFLSQYDQYGFKDKSEMVRAALHQFQQMLELEQLKESANLYAELFDQDNEIVDLTEAGLEDWPE